MIIDPYTWQTLPIEHLETIASETVSIRVAKPPRYEYRAGQYAVIKTLIDGAPVLRQYSFASCPDNDFLEFIVQREPDGVVSNWFHADAVVGATIDISQAFGSFRIDTTGSPALLIAGRVGIAPFISIIRDALSREAGENISLLYSARHDEEFCYPALLEAVSTTLVTTGTGARISPELLSTHLSPSHHVYLCGSKQFVDSLTDELIRLGATRDYIHRELFTLQ